MQQHCPTCGAALMPDAPTCPACGALLGSHEATPPPEAAPTRQTRKLGKLFVLLSLGILLLLVGAGAGAFLLSAHRPSSSASRPPLYANSLTANQRAWQCQPGATCQFEANGLHILAPTDHLYFSVLSGQSFDDQVISVQGKLDNGDPQFVGLAIAFRSVGVDGYGWLVFANGTYELVEWDVHGTVSYLIPLTPSPAIHRGLGQINKLTIIAKHNQITLIINGQRLAQITDDTYIRGNLLLGAARAFADAVFTNLSVTRP
jgi:hypothetical protein